MSNKISTGIWFIFLGTIILLHNLNLIHFNFWAIIPYWPLLIIAVGAKLILQNKKNGALILTIINIGLCTFITVVGITSKKRFSVTDTINITKNTTSSYTSDDTNNPSKLSIPLKESIEKAKLSINVGGVSLKIDSTASIELLQANASENIGLKLEESNDSIFPTIDLNSILKEKKEKGNKITLALNKKPIWDIEINLGATALQANLMNYKISNLELNSGAASMNLILGIPGQNESNIEINTAASSCVIDIPKTAGCRLEMSTVLSSSKLPGFIKKEDYYETENYHQADKKYNISLDGAANSLKINRY